MANDPTVGPRKKTTHPTLLFCSRSRVSVCFSLFLSRHSALQCWFLARVVRTCMLFCNSHVHTRFLRPPPPPPTMSTSQQNKRERACGRVFGYLARFAQARTVHRCALCLCSHLGFSRRVIHQPPKRPAAKTKPNRRRAA